jgi:hypothetical protein
MYVLADGLFAEPQQFSDLRDRLGVDDVEQGLDTSDQAQLPTRIGARQPLDQGLAELTA